MLETIGWSIASKGWILYRRSPPLKERSGELRTRLNVSLFWVW
jgi:hypothetical protein